MRGEPWFFDHEKTFGGVCPDCGGPIYRYCPGCGADMQGEGHVLVAGPPDLFPSPLTVCIDCAQEMHTLSEQAARMRAMLSQP